MSIGYADSSLVARPRIYSSFLEDVAASCAGKYRCPASDAVWTKTGPRSVPPCRLGFMNTGLYLASSPDRKNPRVTKILPAITLIDFGNAEYNPKSVRQFLCCTRSKIRHEHSRFETRYWELQRRVKA